MKIILIGLLCFISLSCTSPRVEPLYNHVFDGTWLTEVDELNSSDLYVGRRTEYLNYRNEFRNAQAAWDFKEQNNIEIDDKYEKIAWLSFDYIPHRGVNEIPIFRMNETAAAILFDSNLIFGQSATWQFSADNHASLLIGYIQRIHTGYRYVETLVFDEQGEQFEYIRIREYEYIFQPPQRYNNVTHGTFSFVAQGGNYMLYIINIGEAVTINESSITISQ